MAAVGMTDVCHYNSAFRSIETKVPVKYDGITLLAGMSSYSFNTDGLPHRSNE